MAIPQYNLAVKGDECQCGRRASVRHCPSCGSTRINARAVEYTPVTELKCSCGQSLDTAGLFTGCQKFKCISCAHIFEDSDREFCAAPPVSAALARRRIQALHNAAQSGESLLPEEQQAAKVIQELLPTKPTVELSGPLSDNAIKNLDFSIRRVWVDKKVAAQLSGQELPTCKDFVLATLREAGYSEAIVDKIKQMHEVGESQ